MAAMNADQVREIFERVAFRMVEAHWLRGYRYIAGLGHEVMWLPEGAQKAVLLKDLGERYGLMDDDDAPCCFHLAAQGLAIPWEMTFPHISIEVSAFWLLCVGELKLGSDPDNLLGMMQIVAGWGPVPPAGE